jgi:cytochrome c peroxidase
MHGNPDATAARLAAVSPYRERFRAAFPRDSIVNGRLLRSAIASYLRSLQALNAPVDRAFRGDTTVLDAEERAGLNLFLGKAACGTCHFAPLFNGTVPPTYRDNELEVLGVPTAAVTGRATIDADPGHFRQSHAAPHAHAFKVPSIRNVALTAPYMHNGVYRSLEQVVDFYNRGGGIGIGAAVPNQTLPAAPLRLAPAEQHALVRFLHALTDTTGTTRTP